MVDPARVRRAILRTDFQAFHDKVFATLRPGTAFIRTWRHQHLASHLSEVARGACRRLAINVPPRSGKSIMASVALPMFILGRDPSTEILAISHTAALAREFSVMRLHIADAPWYREIFPDLDFSAKRKMHLQTTQGGGAFAAGLSGAILGRGADLIVLDDPMSGKAAFSETERRRFREFYDATLLTRLNNKATGRIVLVMQRLHEDDATQHLMETDDFRHVVIPAIETEERDYALSATTGHVYRRAVGEVLDPEREPIEALESVRRIQGALHFQAQYQQDPAPAGGNVIKREWLCYYEDRPETFDRTLISWDTASTLGETSDYSVGTVWGCKGLNYYLLDLVRGRFETPDLRRRIIDLHQRWNADLTIIEKTELGRALVQDLRRSGSLLPKLYPVREGKEARILAQSARFETGAVHLPQNAAYLGAYVQELLAFPNGRHDDQVDSTSQALHYLSSVSHALQARSRPKGRPAKNSKPRAMGAPLRRV